MALTQPAPARPVSPLVPHVPIAIRVATMADLPFMDAMQKQFGRALGYFPTKQFEGYIEMGAVLVAQDVARASRPCMGETPMPLGYCIARDRYLKRDELGVIYQLCVAPGEQRKLIGAALVKAVFERAAYGCRLYCCWCAQDLEANWFWESMGFVPIAFRAGSSGKRRVHIFWQRRINDGDATPWWYPSQTNGGAIREDRLVFPIPPGTNWRDVRAPDVNAVAAPGGALTVVGGELPVKKERPARAGQTPKPREQGRSAIGAGGLRFAVAGGGSGSGAGRGASRPGSAGRRPAAAKPKARIDPRLIAAARELRDRYLERVNGQGASDALLAAPSGKYDVSRAPVAAVSGAKLLPLLKAG